MFVLLFWEFRFWGVGLVDLEFFLFLIYFGFLWLVLGGVWVFFGEMTEGY